MKRLTFVILALLFCLSGCAASTADNASPDKLYRDDPLIDMFVFDSVAYVNASDLEWVKELELTQDALLGSIKRTKVTKNFGQWDATTLPVGSEVYAVSGRQDILLAERDGILAPYYAWREG